MYLKLNLEFHWRFYFNVYLQVVKMTRSNDIQFCKGFWGLAENSFIHVCLLLLGNFY